MTDLLQCDEESFQLCLSAWLHLVKFQDLYSIPELSFNEFYHIFEILKIVSTTSTEQQEQENEQENDVVNTMGLYSRIASAILKVILEDYVQSIPDLSEGGEGEEMEVEGDEEGRKGMKKEELELSVFKTFNISSNVVSHTSWPVIASMVFYSMSEESVLFKAHPQLASMKQAYEEYHRVGLYHMSGKSLMYMLYSLCEIALESSGVLQHIEKMMGERKELIQEQSAQRQKERKERKEKKEKEKQEKLEKEEKEKLEKQEKSAGQLCITDVFKKHETQEKEKEEAQEAQEAEVIEVEGGSRKGKVEEDNSAKTTEKKQKEEPLSPTQQSYIQELTGAVQAGNLALARVCLQ